MKVLYLYSAGEFPTRKTVWSYIYSFRRFSNNFIYYHNVSIYPLPFWAKWVKFDVVIYSHFMTSPWNPERFQMRQKFFENFKLKSSRTIAFHQDEYFHTDMRVKFQNNLGVDTIYSIANTEEATKIYAGMPKETRFEQCLTGYVDNDDLSESDGGMDRPIDIGYRTAWGNSGMFRLGDFGTLKFLIGDAVLKNHGPLKVDIKMGEEFLTGQGWFDFLRRCRFTLGVESGASLLDRDGSIHNKIRTLLAENPDMDYQEVKNRCFDGLDGNLNLKGISPRIFEAAAMKTGMILLEGDYQGVLVPNVHFIPLKADFSNLEEVLKKAADEPARRAMVERTYQDLIASGKYTYARFIEDFFARESIGLTPSRVGIRDWAAYGISYVTDAMGWAAIGLLCWTKRTLASLKAPPKSVEAKI